MYKENVEELNSLLDKVENSYYDLEEILRDKYPSIFLNNND